MKLTNITTGAVIYTGSTTRPSSGDYNFCFGSADEYGSDGSSTSKDYGYLYDLFFYSDNEGKNVIAHYIPYIQNGTVGMYDKINDVFVAANGTLGTESRSVRPKDYPEKATPTISTLFTSTIYINSTHLTTLMRNDTEIVKMDYMRDNILNKGALTNNEILYTSTDGNIVKPALTIGQGWPNIISNTYKNGKGIIKFASNISSIVVNAFYNQNTLNSIIIPDGITFIDAASFYGCSITSIIIPENVTTIGRIDTFITGSFESSRLNSIIINNKVRTIGTRTFGNCYNLRNITYNGTKTQWNAISKGQNWHENVPATVVHCTDGDAPI